MCKIFAITDASKTMITPRLLNTIKDAVCAHDDHGFGYSILGQNNELGGERSVRPKTFKALLPGNGETPAEKLPIVEKTHNQFGVINLLAPKSLIAHGRMSTNTVSLANTHPFTTSSMALIHNGVVRDTTSKVKDVLTTDCDTEVLFRYWLRGGVKEIEENVAGYYAMAILDAKDGRLHIVRDDRAPLFLAWCRTINSYIIATTVDIIRNVSKKMKWKTDAPLPILDNTYAVFDGNTIESHVTITPMGGFGYADISAGASRAFGHTTIDESQTYASQVSDYPSTSVVDDYEDDEDGDDSVQDAYDVINMRLLRGKVK